MSLRSTPASSSAVRAPSKSRVVMAPLNWPHTTPTRSPRPARTGSMTSPARSPRRRATERSSAVSSFDVIESLEEVTHAFTLRAKVLDVERGRTAFDRHPLDDVEPEALEPATLGRVIGQQSHRRDAELDKNLSSDAGLARVDGKTLHQVGVHRVMALFLEGVGANLVRESDAATFVGSQVHDNARTFGRH